MTSQEVFNQNNTDVTVKENPVTNVIEGKERVSELIWAAVERGRWLVMAQGRVPVCQAMIEE